MMLRDMEQDEIFMTIQGFFNKNLDTIKFLRVSIDLEESHLVDGLNVSLTYLKRDKKVLKAGFKIYHTSTRENLIDGLLSENRAINEA